MKMLYLCRYNLNHSPYSIINACANGSLLIPAPWELDAMGSVGGVPAHRSSTKSLYLQRTRPYLWLGFL